MGWGDYYPALCLTRGARFAGGETASAAIRASFSLRLYVFVGVSGGVEHGSRTRTPANQRVAVAFHKLWWVGVGHRAYLCRYPLEPLAREPAGESSVCLMPSACCLPPAALVVTCFLGSPLPKQRDRRWEQRFCSSGPNTAWKRR